MANCPENEIVISSSDEKTGIQAISHSQITKTEPGRLKRVESEYIRNGTTCLIASRNIKTGKLNAYTLGQTRKEGDFLTHVQEIVATQPDKEHVIICDQLNTHKSASLVKWVASECAVNTDLGIKGKYGILKPALFIVRKNLKINFVKFQNLIVDDYFILFVDVFCQISVLFFYFHRENTLFLAIGHTYPKVVDFCKTSTATA